MRRLEALISLVFIRVHSWLKDLFSVSLGLCAACPVWGRNTAPIEVGTREGTLPLPPNRTGGSPASGFPVSGFVVLRWSASTGGLLPRTAAHRAQTIHGASGGAPPPTPAGFGLAAFPAGSPIVASRSHPRSQTHSPGCAGSIHTSRATPGSLPSRWPRSSARRSAHPLSQLLQALRPRPFPAALEVIPEGKSKPPWRARIHHARLAGDAGSAPLRRYYGRSDSRRAALAGLRHEHRLTPAGLPDDRKETSGHCDSNHRRDDRGLARLSGDSAWRLSPALQAWPLARRLARPRRPNRVHRGGPPGTACVSDGSFPFRCSPPRLAATQFRFDTARLFTAPERTCTALSLRLLRRTGAAASGGAGRAFAARIERAVSKWFGAWRRVRVQREGALNHSRGGCAPPRSTSSFRIGSPELFTSSGGVFPITAPLGW